MTVEKKSQPDVQTSGNHIIVRAGLVAGITKEQALTLRYGTEIHYTGKKRCSRDFGPRVSISDDITRVRVTGQCQTWKTRATDFRLPVKYGMYESSAIEAHNARDFHLAADCPLEGPDFPKTREEAEALLKAQKEHGRTVQNRAIGNKPRLAGERALMGLSLSPSETRCSKCGQLYYCEGETQALIHDDGTPLCEGGDDGERLMDEVRASFARDAVEARARLRWYTIAYTEQETGYEVQGANGASTDWETLQICGKGPAGKAKAERYKEYAESMASQGKYPWKVEDILDRGKRMGLDPSWLDDGRIQFVNTGECFNQTVAFDIEVAVGFLDGWEKITRQSVTFADKGIDPETLRPYGDGESEAQ